MVYCFFTVSCVKFLQWSFVIFVGEELTVFGFIREECDKNFENHWSSSLCLGPDEVDRNGLKLLHLTLSRTENPKNKKLFFITDSKTCQVFWAFEQLFSKIAWWVVQLLRHMQTAWFRLKPTGSKGVNVQDKLVIVLFVFGFRTRRKYMDSASTPAKSECPAAS